MSDPSFLRDALPGWLAARRHAVPPAMVERATARRGAGDWRGAATAAGFEVRIDLDDVRNRYGAEVHDGLSTDLRHLVPDLVRWHLPREHTGGLGRVLPDLPITLARYGPVALWVRTPVHLERPLRPHLRFGPLDPALAAVRAETWDGARYLWDARETDGLRHRLQGHERVLELLDAGRYEEGWEAGGVRADLSGDTARNRWSRRPLTLHLHAMVPALAAAVRAADGTFVLQEPSWYTTLVVTARAGEVSVGLAERENLDRPAVLPRVTWQRFPDLDLLRTGRLHRSGLHPSVSSALFPDATDADAAATAAPTTAATTAATTAPDTVRVRCRGAWHRIGWRDGHVDPHDHTPDEARRERTMRSLGGVVPPCFVVTETWREPSTARLPRRLRELRRDALAAIGHGDTDAFAALLDRGIDPAGIRDRRRRTPLHLAAHLDAALVPRLVAAGLDPNATDAIDRTPLGVVLFDGGSAAHVRALLDAGAAPARLDAMGCSPLHLLRSPDAATILPWLLDAGLDLEARDEYGRTPLLAQVIALAPPETLRAMLNAGADPTATDEYSQESIADHVSDNYDDLDFLLRAT